MTTYMHRQHPRSRPRHLMQFTPHVLLQYSRLENAPYGGLGRSKGEGQSVVPILHVGRRRRRYHTRNGRHCQRLVTTEFEFEELLRVIVGKRHFGCFQVIRRCSERVETVEEGRKIDTKLAPRRNAIFIIIVVCCAIGGRPTLIVREETRLQVDTRLDLFGFPINVKRNTFGRCKDGDGLDLGCFAAFTVVVLATKALEESSKGAGRFASTRNNNDIFCVCVVGRSHMELGFREWASSIPHDSLTGETTQRKRFAINLLYNQAILPLPIPLLLCASRWTMMYIGVLTRTIFN